MQKSSNLIKNFCKSLQCLKKNHNRQLIHQICIQNECQNKQLCCYICKQERHEKHQTKSIKIFISEVAAVESFHMLAYSAEIDNIGVRIGKMLYDSKQLLENFDFVHITLKQYLQLKKKYIIKLIGLSNEIKQILKENQVLALSNLQAFYTKYEAFISVEDQHGDKEERKKSIVDIIFSNSIKELKSIELAIQTQKNKGLLTDASVLSMLPLDEQAAAIFKPYFSQTLKASCMNVTATTAEMHQSGTQRIVALMPSLDANQKVKKWKIKIIKLTSWIGVGACHINKLKGADWNFNYSTTNHGSYFISSNGYSWSSLKPEFNSKSYPHLSFKTGETIKLEYDPRKKLLTFQKQEQTQTYSLQIDNNGDPLHPAVNLTSVGDSVQVVY